MRNRSSILIIAEVGVNHNGSVTLAKELVDVAAEAGVDAVKFQTFKSENVVSRVAEKANYQKATTSRRESQLEMLKRLELDESAHRDLIQHCKVRQIQFLSTPFDLPGLDMLSNRMGIPLIKISSGEITNAPFLLEVARTGKPIILSTGMSTLREVEIALGVIAFGYTARTEKPSSRGFRESFNSASGQKALKRNTTLLHCTSEYPAAYSDVNLRAMNTLRETFCVPVGLSDHTPGISIPVAAAALGASVIEKHFTLNRNLPGPDHKASLEPAELADLVRSVRQVEMALGSGIKRPAVGEAKNIAVVRRSLVALRNIRKGEVFSPENLGCKRPGTGRSPIDYWRLLGKKAGKSFCRDEVVTG